MGSSSKRRKRDYNVSDDLLKTTGDIVKIAGSMALIKTALRVAKS